MSFHNGLFGCDICIVGSGGGYNDAGYELISHTIIYTYFYKARQFHWRDDLELNKGVFNSMLCT